MAWIPPKNACGAGFSGVISVIFCCFCAGAALEAGTGAPFSFLIATLRLRWAGGALGSFGLRGARGFFTGTAASVVVAESGCTFGLRPGFFLSFAGGAGAAAKTLLVKSDEKIKIEVDRTSVPLCERIKES